MFDRGIFNECYFYNTSLKFTKFVLLEYVYQFDSMLFVTLFIAWFCLPAFAVQSLPPFVGKGSNAHLAAIPCIPPKVEESKTRYKQITTMAHSPQYNNVMELTSHLQYTSAIVDENFQDVPSDRNTALPKGWVAHNTVLKLQCSNGHYLSTDSSKSEFYARCYNGEVSACKYEPLAQQSAGMYSTYAGSEDLQSRIRGCLASERVIMPECRQMCDVTKFAGNENYTVNTDVQIFHDFNGFLLSGAESYATYYFVRPQSNILIQCVNETFLSHSTEDTKHTEFAVSCSPNGYVEYPNNGTEDPSQGHSMVCTSNHACTMPSDTHLRGIYRNGNFVEVNLIPHGGSVYLYCDKQRKVAQQHTLSCINGLLFPDTKYLCESEKPQP